MSLTESAFLSMTVGQFLDFPATANDEATMAAVAQRYVGASTQWQSLKVARAVAKDLSRASLAAMTVSQALTAVQQQPGAGALFEANLDALRALRKSGRRFDTVAAILAQIMGSGGSTATGGTTTGGTTAGGTAPGTGVGAGGGLGNVMQNQIQHVVVLMLENRGFDHALGWLYDGEEPMHNYPIADEARPRRFNGLNGLDLDTLRNRLEGQLDGEDVLILDLPPHKAARSPAVPSHNPHEDYIHILTDMTGVPYDLQDGTEPITMNGFVLDYSSLFDKTWTEAATLDTIGEIMDTYVPEQLPVLAGLAKHYAVSDAWFCSVPSQTNTNRAFSLCGTARGMATNDFYGGVLPVAADTLPAGTITFFDVLNNAGFTGWTYFWSTKWPPAVGKVYPRGLCPSLAASAYNGNFHPIADFYTQAAAGTLPRVSFLEPAWGGGATLGSLVSLNGNDYHPACDTTKGERFVKAVYDALSTGPNWNSTLLVVTFDENGGTYDHVPPPTCTPPGALDQVPQVPPYFKNGKYVNKDTDPTTRTQFGFTFNRLGVRVPTLLISPLIAKGTVFRSPTPGTPFDHTSLISTILKWAGIDPTVDRGLGARVMVAPTFDGVPTLTTPRPAGDPTVGINFGTKPTRANGAVALNYGDRFTLRYIGNKWDPRQRNPRYILAAEAGLGGLGHWYPRIGPIETEDAIDLMFTGGTTGTPVPNNATVQIVSTETKVTTFNTLGAFSGNHFLYYYTPGSNNQNWQVQLAGYVGTDNIFIGDQVLLFSVAFDIQRMLPDAEQPAYLTTAIGQWAYWLIDEAN